MRAVFSRPLNSWDLLKILALLLMFVDHTGAFIFTHPAQEYWLRAVGRGAAPTFMFLAGFAASYRFNWEVFLLALALTMSDFTMLGQVNTLNILFTILLSRAIFQWFEKRGRVIQRPYEWFACSLVLFPTMALMHYGSFGFLFAFCGYLKRHANYPRQQVRNIMILTFLTFGLYEFAFSAPPISLPTMVATLLCVYFILSRFEVEEVKAPWCPAWLKAIAKVVSYYSAYIYVLHLMVLEWMTRIPL